MESPSYLIVGAGIFGASTALYLKQQSPSTKVTILDRQQFPNSAAASSDLNKIIRADYDDIFYMKLALEAQELWRSDPIYRPYYHESGMLFAEDMGMGSKSFRNYNTLGIDHAAEMMTPGQARERFPVFKEANWDDVEENYYNARSGWGEGEPALRSLVQAAIDAGAEFVQGQVAKLSFAEDKSCIGAKLADGTEILADRTVLCTGAHTAKLLADTDPNWSELQVGGRMVAAAAVQCQAKYDPEEEERLSKAPVHFIGMWHTHGESIPSCNGRLKFNCEVSFTNMEYHEGLGKEISVPPRPTSQSTFGDDVPVGLKEEVQNVVKNTYGNAVKGIEIVSYRMCWDAVTPNQDWIVDKHPASQNLYVAGGGSFHSWKFLPNIGKYVVQKLIGTLDEEKSKRWAWDREDTGAACIMYIPTRDVKKIDHFQGWPKVTVKV